QQLATPLPAAVAAIAKPAPPTVHVASTSVTTVTLTSEPNGAEVDDIQGRALGVTPMDLPATSGKPLQLVFKHEGYEPFTMIRPLVSGDRLAVSARLKKSR